MTMASKKIKPPSFCNRMYIVFAILLPFLVSVWYKVNFPNGQLPAADHGNGQMFDLIAYRYDTINRVLAVGMDVGWRQVMVDRIARSVRNIERPQILDVATGTADVALLLAKTIPTANILGVDPSHKMLAVGADKIQQRNLSDHIKLLQIDDKQQQYTDFAAVDYFDAATVSFGIRNVPDRRAALCEIHAVLKPKAMFTILEFSEPDDSFGTLGILARLFIRHVVPVLGGILSGKPREYLHLQNSIRNFPTPPEFKRLLEHLDCVDGEGNHGGHFDVESIKQLNFGSVQLYVSRTVKPKKQQEK
jgi:demethylmenaquinone methyltransferase / 2-methoxy-6-polyprenyl-1,4-benzoquinol methylase